MADAKTPSAYKQPTIQALIYGGIAIVTIFVSNVLTHVVEAPVVHNLENLFKKK